VVDPQPGGLLHGLYGELGAAELIRGVDLVGALARDRRPGVPRQADDGGLPVVLRQVDHHHGVAALPDLPAEVELVLLPPGQVVALVDADQQDVHRALRAGLARAGVHRLDLAGGVVGHQPQRPGADQHSPREGAGDRQRSEICPLSSGAPCLDLDPAVTVAPDADAGVLLTVPRHSVLRLPSPPLSTVA
jgi:hypothetical protein